MENKSLKQAQKQALRKTDVSGSYIRIEIVDYFGTKKVIEVKPYFDKQQNVLHLETQSQLIVVRRGKK